MYIKDVGAAGVRPVPEQYATLIDGLVEKKAG